MKRIAFNTILAGLAVTAVVLTGCKKESLVPTTNPTAANSALRLAPDVPTNLAVPAGYYVIYHAYATGVQIYQVTQSTTDPTVYTWTFVAPSATLYANANYSGNGVGMHYAGPTWESNSGSKVVGTKLQAATVDANAIPWLLLGTVSNSGNGVFSTVSYIQRVNTVGGKAPTTGADADHLGQQVSVPYTAEYYFYAAE